jgi:translation initiation factor eIF-2B subunit delta
MNTQQGSSSASAAPAASASTSSSQAQAVLASATATPQSSPGPGAASASGSATRKNKRAERVAARAAGGGDAGAGAGSAEPILSKAERKAKQAAEAAAAAAGGSGTGSGAGSAANSSNAGTVSQRARDSVSGHATGKVAAAHRDSPNSLNTNAAAAALFGNVSLPQTTSQQSSSLITSVHKRAVHPSILLLSSLLASKQLTGANARAMAVLLALRDFIAQYRTPMGATLTRDLVTKLGVQIGHLKEARPLGTSVGHAIRYLKYEISVTDKDWDEQTVS